MLFFAATSSSAAQRQRLSMGPGWRFTLGDPAGAQQPSFDDRRWRSVNLPHDWSIEGMPREDAPGGGGMGYFPAGIGWYRKTFRLPRDARGRTAWLEPYRSDRRRAFNGRGLAILRAEKPGMLRVSASADGLKSATVRVTVVRGTAHQAVPAAR